MFPLVSFGYEDDQTHPALSSQIVDFYNKLHPKDSISKREKRWIMKGSKQEDRWPRWWNHFYDPVREISFNGNNLGSLSKKNVQNFSDVFITPRDPLAATEWVTNRQAQSSYGRYGGDQTYGKALESLKNNKRRKAFLALGHVLHLLEDMGVPAHTRNDLHPPLGRQGKRWIGESGSPYEEFASRYTPQNIEKKTSNLEELM
ncbi:MAG: hypothetical protein ABEI53_00065, partial [Candidatus Magasanikbacteria bacterium]